VPSQASKPSGAPARKPARTKQPSASRWKRRRKPFRPKLRLFPVSTRTLAQLGIRRSTFSRLVRALYGGGAGALEEGQLAPRLVSHRRSLTQWLSWPFNSRNCSRASWPPRSSTNGILSIEASVYRLLKARGLIASPAFILLRAADHFAQPTTAVIQLWQTDFSYLRVIAEGGMVGRGQPTGARSWDKMGFLRKAEKGAIRFRSIVSARSQSSVPRRSMGCSNFPSATPRGKVALGAHRHATIQY
jgi:hypothetical protein